MALTSTLKDVNPSDNIVARPQAGGGFVSSLARLGSNLSTVAGANQQQFERDRTRDALNTAEQTAFDARMAANTALEAPAASESVTPAFDMNGFLTEGQSGLSEIPAEVRKEIDGLAKIKRGVDGGTLPQASFDLNFERSVEKLYRQFPEERAAIAQYYQARGMDHFMFRELTATMDAQKNAEAQRLANENFVIKAGVDAGLSSPTDSRDVQIATGQAFLAATTRYKQEKERLELSKTRAELSALEKRAIEESANTGMLKSVLAGSDLRLDGQMRQFEAFVAESIGGKSADAAVKQKIVLEAAPAFIQRLQQDRDLAIQQLIRDGADENTRKAAKESFDMRINTIEEMLTGKLSANGVAQASFARLQNDLGLSVSETIPLWSLVSKVPGLANSLALEIAGGQPGALFTEEQKSALKAELRGITVGTPDGAYRLFRVGEILRGRLDIKQMDLPEAQDAIRMVRASVLGMADDINKNGNRDIDTVEGLLNGSSTLAEAVRTLSPSAEYRDFAKAAEMLADPDFYKSMATLAKDPKWSDRVGQTVLGVRAAAQDALLDMKTGEWNKSSPGALLKLAWNARSGVTEIVIDETAYQRYVKNVNRNVGSTGFAERGLSVPSNNTPMTREAVLRAGDAKLEERKKAFNGFISVVVNTARIDPTVPATATNRQIGEAAFMGRPLESISADTKSVASFESRVQSFKDSLTSTTMDISEEETTDLALEERRRKYEPIAHKYADQFGVPRAIMSFVAGQESGWNPAVGRTKVDVNGDGKPDSTATGMMQFIDSTARQYGLLGEGFDHRGDANKSLEAGARLLADNFRRTGSWEKALEAYGVTDKRNFKKDEDYQAVLARARRALQNG